MSMIMSAMTNHNHVNSSSSSINRSNDTESGAGKKPRLRLRLQEELLEPQSKGAKSLTSTPTTFHHFYEPMTPSPSPITPRSAYTSAQFSPGFHKGLRHTQDRAWQRPPSSSSVHPAHVLTSGPSTMLTASPPKFQDSKKSFQNGCIMWVHLQASICTEWEQNSMVLTPGSQSGARVTTEEESANKEQAQHAKKSSVTSLLQALTGSDSAYGHMNGGPGGGKSHHPHSSLPPQKRPKTIHRCILQRASKGAKGQANLLRCHVCDDSYDTYQRYLDHLLDATCAKVRQNYEQKQQQQQQQQGKHSEQQHRQGGHPAQRVTDVHPRQSNGVRRGRPPGSTNLPKPYRRLKSMNGLPSPAEQQHQLQQQMQQQQQHRPPPPYRRFHSDQHRPQLSDRFFDRSISATATSDIVSPSLKRALNEDFNRNSTNVVEEGRKRKKAEAVFVDLAQEELEKKQADAVFVDLARSELPALEKAERLVVQKDPGSPAHITVAKWARLAENRDSDPGHPISTKAEVKAAEEGQAEGGSNTDNEDEESMGPLNLSTSSGSSASDVQEARDLDNKERATVTREGTCCFHREAATLPVLSLVEHAADQARLAKLRESLTGLLVALLGEDRLEEMGFPDKDVISILRSVLESANCPVASISDQCGDDCPCDDVGSDRASSSSSSGRQLRFRRTRREIAVGRANARALMEVCVADGALWGARGWADKPVEEVMDEALADGHVGKGGGKEQ